MSERVCVSVCVSVCVPVFVCVCVCGAALANSSSPDCFDRSHPGQALSVCVRVRDQVALRTCAVCLIPLHLALRVTRTLTFTMETACLRPSAFRRHLGYCNLT